MEGYLALMIPIVAMSIPIVAIITKHRRNLAEMKIRAGNQFTAEQSAASAQRIAALEERVKVLERIVTDGSYSVAAQIEALRDTAPVPPRTTSAAYQERL